MATVIRCVRRAGIAAKYVPFIYYDRLVADGVVSRLRTDGMLKP